jgi:hypothetical protein
VLGTALLLPRIAEFDDKCLRAEIVA